MNVEKFREIIKERIRISIETQDEWDYGIEQCWEQEIETLSDDIPGTIEFLKNECAADEYSWISEILEELAERTQSKELVECYKSLTKKFPEECKKYYIEGVIENAELMISGGGDGEND